MRVRRAAGMALVLIGAMWIVLTNRGTRHSTLGLAAGIGLILSGLVRLWMARSEKPEPPSP